MTTPTSPIDVRLLSAPEMHIALDWARLEGWNPGPNDAASFFAVDPEGFWASLHDGEPAAVVSVVRYGETFGFLGLYICRPELRGMGYGKRVWDAALAAAGNRVIGLDGVPAQQDNYRRSGFELAWGNRRYRGVGRPGIVAPDVVDLDTVPFAQLAAYDAATFEADRQRFLRVWVAQPDAVRLGVVRDGALVGWGLLRRCADGYKIGPLMADDASVAERLLDAFLASVPGAPVFLDVPEPNTAAVDMAKAHGMTVSFETARMYRGVAPTIALDRVWGITTFELG